LAKSKNRNDQHPAAELSAREAIRATTDESYRDHSDLLYLMHELSRMISTHADHHLAKAGITHVQWWAMMHIYEHEGLTQTDLAEVMQMGRASLGKLVERLEAKSWIERRPDASDSRVRRVFLRHAAVPLFAHMTAEGKALFKTFLAGISPAEEKRLLAGLRKIRRNAVAAEGD
jgi:MarR family transcriptional regulator, transcriptional regulator for hemolysin